jgi:hypothetical protein
MYQYQFTNNPVRSNNWYITFKALAIEPHYMQESNPTEPVLSEVFQLIPLKIKSIDEG